MEEAKEKMDKVNKQLMQFKVFQMFNENTNLPPGALAMAVVVFSVLVCVFKMPFANQLVHLVGVAFPCYKSFEALRSEDDAEDDKHWLTYWMVFSLFNFIDTNLDFLLNYIPFYFLIKLLALVWLQNPMTDGAKIFYENVVQPSWNLRKDEYTAFLDGFEAVLSSIGNLAVAAEKEAKSKMNEEKSASATKETVKKAVPE